MNSHEDTKARSKKYLLQLILLLKYKYQLTQEHNVLCYYKKQRYMHPIEKSF